MAGMTAAASIADALRTQSVSGVVEALFLNSEVMGEFQMREFTGGSTINIKMHYAGNASVGTYAEGDAIGVAGSQSYLTALWPEQHYKCVIQITGHARDYLRNGSNGAAFFDQVGMEFERAANDLVDKVSQDMLGSGQTAPIGIQGIVSSSGTVAGLSRSTYSWFQSYQVAGVATTIAVGDIDGAMFNSTDATYAGAVDAIWCSWKQQNKLKGVMGNIGIANGPVRVMAEAGKSLGFNMGDVRDSLWVGNIPIKPKRNLTNSIFLGLTTADFFIGRMRDWTVDQLGKTDDSDKFLVTGSFGLGCANPKRSWKITTLTA